MWTKKLQEWFMFSAAVMLFVAAVFVLLTVFGENRVLDLPDGLLGVTGRTVFYVAGLLMLAVSAVLLVLRSAQMRLMVCAWLAANLLVYQVGVSYCGSANLFVCLGNLDSPVPLSPKLLVVVAYACSCWLLLGSAALLVAGWLARRRTTRRKDAPAVSESNTVAVAIAH